MNETTAASALIAMMRFALATSVSPGPVNIVSAMSGANFGARRTIPYVLGATIGFVSILAITGSGLSSIFQRLPWLEHVLGIIGSFYMLFIAYKIARVSVIEFDDNVAARPPGIVSGIFAQYSNPKAWFVSLSAVSVYVSVSPDYGVTLFILCCIFLQSAFLRVWHGALSARLFQRRRKS